MPASLLFVACGLLGGGRARPAAAAVAGPSAAAVRASSASSVSSSRSASAAADGLRAELLELLERNVGSSGRYSLGSDSGERARVLELVAALEATSAPPVFPQQLAELDGSWDLIFTTNAISLDANLFGSLSALPAALPSLSPLLDGSPLRTRRVRQEIDVARGRVRNCVTLTAWPEGSARALVPLPPFLADVLAGLQGADLTLTLDHAATVEAPMGGELARLRIELQAVKRTLEPGPTASVGAGAGSGSAASSVGAGLLDLIPKETSYTVPWPLSSLQAGRFDTSYLDPLLRVSRGVPPGREVRVFRRSATKAVVVSEGRGM